MTVGEGQIVCLMNILARLVVKVASVITPDENQIDPDPNMTFDKYLKPSKLTKATSFYLDELNGITKFFEKITVYLDGVLMETSNFGTIRKDLKIIFF